MVNTMDANDIYGAPAIASTFDLSQIIGVYTNIFPELNVIGSFNQRTRDNIRENNRSIEFRVTHQFSNSYERYNDVSSWLIASMWYNSEAFMIMRNVGRNGDNYPSFFVTDSQTYHTALYHLFSLLEVDADFSDEAWSPLSGTITTMPGELTMVEVAYDDPTLIKALNHSIRYGPLTY
jgi:hypothetical protein